MDCSLHGRDGALAAPLGGRSYPVGSRPGTRRETVARGDLPEGDTMGRTRKLLGLAAIGALVVPPLAAALARTRFLPTGEDEDDLRVAAIFDGTAARATSIALRRGTAVAWYGGLGLDLREATLDPAGARLRVVALFGAARVIVPRGWDVDVRRIALFGAVDTQVEEPGRPAPRLSIDALVAFGAVEITDRPDEDDVRIEAPPTDAAFARAEAEAELEAAVEEGVGAAPGEAPATPEATEGAAGG